MRVARAQAHTGRHVSDCQVWFTQPNPYPAACIPRSRYIRIEHKSSINKGRGGVEIADNKRQRMSTAREGNRVLRAETPLPAGPAVRFRRFL